MRGWHAALLLVLIGLAACDAVSPSKESVYDPRQREIERTGKIFGDDIFLFGGTRKRDDNVSGIAVNSFLWRASLDTVGFMPLASADPFGGVIITDWYSPGDAPNERFKVTVYILDRQLRADGLRAAVFRQVRDRTGNWADATVDPRTQTDLENAILTRARQMRLETTSTR